MCFDNICFTLTKWRKKGRKFSRIEFTHTVKNTIHSCIEKQIHETKINAFFFAIGSLSFKRATALSILCLFNIRLLYLTLSSLDVCASSKKLNTHTQLKTQRIHMENVFYF